MSTRSNTLVTGKEIVIGIKVSSTYIAVGCADDVTFKASKEKVEYSCRSGSGSFPSGKNATGSITIKGFYFEYADAAEGVTEIGAESFANYLQSGEIKEWKFGAPHTNDMNISGKAMVSDFTLSASTSGLATYDVTLDFTEAFTIAKAT
jgi:predicted secreted protein